jgi:hypothetical protein
MPGDKAGAVEGRYQKNPPFPVSLHFHRVKQNLWKNLCFVGYKESVKETESSGNIMPSGIKVEK